MEGCTGNQGLSGRDIPYNNGKADLPDGVLLKIEEVTKDPGIVAGDLTFLLFVSTLDDVDKFLDNLVTSALLEDRASKYIPIARNFLLIILATFTQFMNFNIVSLQSTDFNPADSEDWTKSLPVQLKFPSHLCKDKNIYHEFLSEWLLLFTARILRAIHSGVIGAYFSDLLAKYECYGRIVFTHFQSSICNSMLKRDVIKHYGIKAFNLRLEWSHPKIVDCLFMNAFRYAQWQLCLCKIRKLTQPKQTEDACVIQWKTKLVGDMEYVALTAANGKGKMDSLVNAVTHVEGKPLSGKDKKSDEKSTEDDIISFLFPMPNNNSKMGESASPMDIDGSALPMEIDRERNGGGWSPVPLQSEPASLEQLVEAADVVGV